MKDAHRGIISEPTDVPFGIAVIVDGHRHLVDFSRIPDHPLRRQLRDAALTVLIDRGGNVRSAQSLKIYRDATTYALKRLAEHPAQPTLDIRHLSAEIVHAAIFDGGSPPIPVRVVLARRLLLESATAVANTQLAAYLANLRLYGYAQSGPGYTDDELEAVLDASIGRLRSRFAKRGIGLRALGLPTQATDGDALTAALNVLARPLSPSLSTDSDEARRWWAAHVYANAFATPSDAPLLDYRPWAMDAFFPDRDDMLAAVMLVINEFGAEGQVLTGLQVGDVRRLPGSSVVQIRGVKSRANRAVSRRGNTISEWSGGRVLERWIELTGPARRWTGSDQVFQWRLARPVPSPKNLRLPIQGLVPERPIIQEGHEGVDGANGKVPLSTRRMRKTWAFRAERALGSGLAGTVDPEHSPSVSWNFYRWQSLTLEARQQVVVQAQEDLRAIIEAVVVLDTSHMRRQDVVTQLIDHGVSRQVAERVARGSADDSGAAYCRDPKAAPGQVAGSLCKQMPFACLACPNAICTTAHLPVVLALQEAVQTDRAQLPAEEYVDRWATLDASIERILRLFSEVAVEEALRALDVARSRVQQWQEVAT